MRSGITSIRRHVGLARVLACLMLVLVGDLSPWAPSPRAEAPGLPPHGPRSAGLPDSQNGTRPLAGLLNPDGALDLTSGYHGSLDPRGWRLVSAPDEVPRFAPLAAPGDQLWSDEFTVNGLSGGTPATVRAIAVSGSNVYTGGQFASPGVSIVHWDGTRWCALAMGGTNLYAGGYFTQAGGVAANRIARWDAADSTWSALIGGGADNTVREAATDAGGGLPGAYIGGDFSSVGGVWSPHVAWWDGGHWRGLGSGVDGLVFALAQAPDHKLYAGGSFTTAGGLSANRVARWDGAHWSALGSGTHSTVLALAPGSACDLYVGGQFAIAGGIPDYGIARRLLLCERVYLPLALRN